MSHLASDTARDIQPRVIGMPPAKTYNGPCDFPHCTRDKSDKSCRFRGAKKLELDGKQVCPNQDCQFWGGNRDKEKEQAAAAEKRAADKAKREAAAAAEKAAKEAAAATEKAAKEVRPTAVKTKAAASPPRQQPSAPLRQPSPRPRAPAVRSARPPQYATVAGATTITGIAEIFGCCAFNPCGDRDGEGMDRDISGDRDDIVGDDLPHYLVHCYTTDEAGGDFVRLEWLAEDKLIEVFKLNDDKRHACTLLNGMISFNYWQVDGLLRRARKSGLGGTHHCASANAVDSAISEAMVYASVADTCLNEAVAVQSALATSEVMSKLAKAVACNETVAAAVAAFDDLDAPMPYAFATSAGGGASSAAEATDRAAVGGASSTEATERAAVGGASRTGGGGASSTSAAAQAAEAEAEAAAAREAAEALTAVAASPARAPTAPSGRSSTRKRAAPAAADSPAASSPRRSPQQQPAVAAAPAAARAAARASPRRKVPLRADECGGCGKPVVWDREQHTQDPRHTCTGCGHIVHSIPAACTHIAGALLTSLIVHDGAWHCSDTHAARVCSLCIEWSSDVTEACSSCIYEGLW